jgi:hypothetical protein
LDHFGGRKSEDFAENPLPRISMFTSSRCWSDFGRISQQIRGFQIDYECGLFSVAESELKPQRAASFYGAVALHGTAPALAAQHKMILQNDKS